MMLRKTIFPFILLLILMAAIACNSRPDGVMRAGKMENVLYDYHIARAIVLNEGKPDDVRDRRYEQAVFTKHGITADDFYASLRYYEAHPKEFGKIYENLDARFSGIDMAKSKDENQKSDTLKGREMWSAARFFVLSSSGCNRYTFDMPLPKNLKRGDRLQWTFDLQWIYPEGRKNGTALMVYHYANDSTETFSQPLYGTGHQTLLAPIGKAIPQRVSGFIYQECPWNKKSYLLVVSDVSLRLINSRMAERPQVERPNNLKPAQRPGARPDTALSEPDTMSSPQTDAAPQPMPKSQPMPDPGVRLSRQEGERRILDSLRRRERGRQPHFR